MKAVASAGSTWKLAVCASCEVRRMMPAGNGVCLCCQEKIERKRKPGRKPAVEVPNLRVLREARGLAVPELARAAGVEATTVKRLENRAGTPNPQRAQNGTAEKLAFALGVEVESLSGCRTRVAA